MTPRQLTGTLTGSRSLVTSEALTHVQQLKLICSQIYNQSQSRGQVTEEWTKIHVIPKTVKTSVG